MVQVEPGSREGPGLFMSLGQLRTRLSQDNRSATR
jgi:hypothetical protein